MWPEGLPNAGAAGGTISNWTIQQIHTLTGFPPFLMGSNRSFLAYLTAASSKILCPEDSFTQTDSTSPFSATSK